MTVTLAPGLLWWPGYLEREAQQTLLAAVREVVAAAPLFRPVMPRTGAPFTVLMTNCGALGWVSDVDGYRYQATHPATRHAWPAMPTAVERAWADLAGHDAAPEACLVNYYAAGARMGLHQDRDEADVDAPVLSLSLGETALFRFGGTERRGPTRSIRLASGDALLLGGAARLAFHGIDRLVPGSSTLLAEGGRFNLTIRRATKVIASGA